MKGNSQRERRTNLVGDVNTEPAAIYKQKRKKKGSSVPASRERGRKEELTLRTDRSKYRKEAIAAEAMRQNERDGGARDLHENGPRRRPTHCFCLRSRVATGSELNFVEKREGKEKGERESQRTATAGEGEWNGGRGGWMGGVGGMMVRGKDCGLERRAAERLDRSFSKERKITQPGPIVFTPHLEPIPAPSSKSSPNENKTPPLGE